MIKLTQTVAFYTLAV